MERNRRSLILNVCDPPLLVERSNHRNGNSSMSMERSISVWFHSYNALHRSGGRPTFASKENNDRHLCSGTRRVLLDQRRRRRTAANPRDQSCAHCRIASKPSPPRDGQALGSPTTTWPPHTQAGFSGPAEPHRQRRLPAMLKLSSSATGGMRASPTSGGLSSTSSWRPPRRSVPGSSKSGLLSASPWMISTFWWNPSGVLRPRPRFGVRALHLNRCHFRWSEPCRRLLTSYEKWTCPDAD